MNTTASWRGRIGAGRTRVVPGLFRARGRRLETGAGSGSYVWPALGLLATAAVAAWLGGRKKTFWSRARKVQDVMIPDVVTIQGSTSIMAAADRMREANVGALPIVDDDQLVGIVTDRDIVVRAIAKGADPASTPVRECATKTVVSARPDWMVNDAMRVMAEHQIGRLPVTDEHRRVIGIVTLGSLALRSHAEEDTLETAQEVTRRSARAA